MLKRVFPLPVKPICGFIYSQEETYQKAKHLLSRRYGPIDYESACIDFSFTDYYAPEMGQGLTRRFLSFNTLIVPDGCVGMKLFSLKLENKFADARSRVVNIDPGYINEAKLVLTTTKDFAHRIYLRKGVYAEVTLVFRQGQFCDLPSTFPDYRTVMYKDIFEVIRELYRAQIHPSP